jgi:hypothetical protein
MPSESYIVPSGTILVIPIKIIQTNPDFWPNPDVFDPDRFLPENIQNRHPFSYLPFSAGPRNCIGNISNINFLICKSSVMFLNVNRSAIRHVGVKSYNSFLSA